MKKTTLAFLLIVLVLGGYFYLDFKKSGGMMLLNFFSRDLRIVAEKGLSFMEDLKFKDFVRAATYHSPEDQKKVNIPSLIEHIFQIKPEFLDIMEYKILETNLDSTKKRARVKIKAKVHLLNSDEIRNPEIILYFHLKNNQWFMELESSLQ